MIKTRMATALAKIRPRRVLGAAHSQVALGEKMLDG